MQYKGGVHVVLPLIRFASAEPPAPTTSSVSNGFVLEIESFIHHYGGETWCRNYWDLISPLSMYPVEYPGVRASISAPART